jgi:cobyrinic acid a,c-diamide synthase
MYLWNKTTMTGYSCPALLISAPASGQGKTIATAALARHHRQRGRRVHVFKTGPDFLDPMILGHAAGSPVYQLDLWMVGEQACQQLLYEAAREADLILIEGVMGLFDGEPSSADLAEFFGIPVLAVIQAQAMAQTFGAIAYGLAHYRNGLPFAGVLANQVASVGHGAMLTSSLPTDCNYFGALPRDPTIALPDRHLGLVQAEEIDDLDKRLNAAAAAIAETCLTDLPETVIFPAQSAKPPPRLLTGVRISVAHDRAFSFLYPANLALLRDLGAELVFFSPLQDSTLPRVDSLYLPGGYPELHLEPLSNNRGMRQALHQHYQAGKPIYAECGGMLYLLETLTDKQGQGAAMVGLLPGHAVMQPRLAALGFQTAALPEGELRGHTFHHSRSDIPLSPLVRGTPRRGGSPGEAIYRTKRLTASYLHLYFPGNPPATAQLFLP